MPKYWGGNYFAHGRFPEVGQKQKTEKEKKREKRRDQTTVITMAKLRMAHAGTHGARRHAWRTQAAWAKRRLSYILFLLQLVSHIWSLLPSHNILCSFCLFDVFADALISILDH